MLKTGLTRLLTGTALLLTLAVGLSGCAASETVEGPPPPRPTVIVITVNGPYFTSFEQPRDWLMGDTENSYGRIENDQYVLTVRQPDYLAWTHQQRVFGEGTYEVEATLLSGPKTSAYGLLLLGSSNVGSFIYCVITADGRYDIGYCENGCEKQESLIGGYGIGYAILAGNQTNRLQVSLSESSLTFAVNGVALSQLDNIAFDRGLVGLIGESSHNGGFDVAFDNLKVIEDNPQ